MRPGSKDNECGWWIQWHIQGLGNLVQVGWGILGRLANDQGEPAVSYK